MTVFWVGCIDTAMSRVPKVPVELITNGTATAWNSVSPWASESFCTAPFMPITLGRSSGMVTAGRFARGRSRQVRSLSTPFWS